MIQVEIQQRNDSVERYAVAGTLTVEDDGTYHFAGDRSVFPTYLPVLVLDAQDQFHRVAFEDDPATWARHLDSVMRTGYSVPVITRDESSLGAAW